MFFSTDSDEVGADVSSFALRLRASEIVVEDDVFEDIVGF